MADILKTFATQLAAGHPVPPLNTNRGETAMQVLHKRMEMQKKLMGYKEISSISFQESGNTRGYWVELSKGHCYYKNKIHYLWLPSLKKIKDALSFITACNCEQCQ